MNSLSGYSKVSCPGANLAFCFGPPIAIEQVEIFGSLSFIEAFVFGALASLVVLSSAFLIFREKSRTQPRQAEKNLPPKSGLEESETRFRTLAENTFDLISEIDSEGRFVYVSPNIETICGYTPDELVGRLFTEHIHSDDLTDVLARFKSSMEQLAGDQISLRYRHKNGTWMPLESSGKAYRLATGEVHAVVISRDLRPRLALERELLKTKKLESLGILAGGIAHDFNNILTAILINVSTAKMDLSKDEDIYTLLNEAQNACLQAKELMEQLLTFSKRGTLVRRTTSVVQMLRDTVRFALRGSNVACEYKFAGDLWAANIDEVQISQVINNVVLNAVQAMPEGGRILVNAQNVVVDNGTQHGLENGKYLKISFEDEGQGIPEQHLTQIFDPYFTTKPDSSGLGLSTSYSIVKSHGGAIVADSRVGEGTSVTCYLPASPDTTSEAPAEAKQVPLHYGSGRILVMDDDPQIRSSLIMILTRLGYEVEVEKDGDAAVTAYAEAMETGVPFQAVIVDLTVPGGKGGKETLAGLLEIDADVKAIVTSGYVDDPVLRDHKRYGFVEVLSKPFDVEEVSRKMYKVILA